MISYNLNHVSFDKFDSFQKGILDYANTNATIMGIDPHVIADLHTASADWQDAYQKCKSGGTVNKQEREARSVARISFARKLSVFIAGLYLNERVTTVDLAAMNLPLAKRVKYQSRVLNLREVPYFTIQTLRGAILSFLCNNSQGRAAKPEGAVGIQIRYYIGTTPPADPADFPFVLTSTTCKGEFTVDRNQAFQPIHVAACWQGKGTQTGVYSNVEVTAIAP